MAVPLDARIFVAGHSGLVGSAIVRNLLAHGYQDIVTVDRSQLDLRNQSAVNDWFAEARPTHVYVAAGKVGGIAANSQFPAEFIYDNLMIHASVVDAAHRHGVEKLLYLGSSCIYPREAPQPLAEESLLSGPLEPTNEAYAVAKIAGIKLCQFYREQYGCDFISAMPTNLYGPGDNFDLETSHVLPALLRKFDDARHRGEPTVEVWGSGIARREFLYVDDLADACRHLMNVYSDSMHINVGTGIDLTIKELAELIRDCVNPQAEIRFDPTRPDGTPRKVLDVERLTATGWRAPTTLEQGLEATYRWYQANGEHARGVATNHLPTS